MPRVRITHTTEYRYSRPVRLTPHRLMIRPRDSHDLRLNTATLTIEPAGATIRWAHDVFGNSICHLHPDPDRTSRFRIVSALDLQHFPAPPELSVAPIAEYYPFTYPVEETPDLARLVERLHPDPDRAVEGFARRFVTHGGATRSLDLLIAITEAIRNDFTYERREAEGTRSPAETLARGRGACRDFALLMMEAVRALGFAAMFVSGYLYDDTPESDGIIGGGATHAWCMVYLPGAGWVEFDPTNGLVAGHNLIRVCRARTPDQAVPIAGGFIGAANDRAALNVNVTVAVGDPQTTQPSPNLAAPLRGG